MNLVSVFDWRFYPFVEVLPWSESIGLSVEPYYANTLEKSWVWADRRGSPDDESWWTLLPLVTRQPQRRRQVGVQQLKSLDNDGLGQVEALPGDHEEAENQHDDFFSDEVRKSLEKIAVFPHKHKAGRQCGTNFDRWAPKIPLFRRPVAREDRPLSSMLTTVAARQAAHSVSRGNCSELMALTYRFENGDLFQTWRKKLAFSKACERISGPDSDSMEENSWGDSSTHKQKA